MIRRGIVAVVALVLGISCGCAGRQQKVDRATIRQRTSISIGCAGGETADRVEALATGFDYRLVAGGMYPDEKVWFSGDRIAFEISGLDIARRYILELETPGYELKGMPQTVVVDTKLVASGWKGEPLGVYLSKDSLEDSRVLVVLISELQFSALGNFRLIENPVRYPREPVDMTRCEPFEEPAPSDLIAEMRRLAPVEVEVDAGTPSGEFNRLWEGTMDIVPRMKDLKTRHVRLWGSGLFAGAFPAEGVYDWEHLDSVLEKVVSLGAHPFITLTSVPQWLWRRGASDEVVQGVGVPARRVGDITPPRSLEKWADLVRDTVSHLNVHRQFEVQYLEVWNEPTAKVFWNGTLQEYLELYEATATAAKQADSSIKVGGPATAGLQPEWIRALMRYCSERDIPLDFVSWHCFSRDPARYGKQADYVRELAAEIGIQPELCVTEWNYAWGVRERERLNAPFAASYALASIKAMEDAGLDRAIYFASADWTGLGTYSGLVTSDAKTPKPVYNAFKMLSLLGNDRVKAVSQAEKAGLDVLAARNGRELDAILWWWVKGTGKENAAAPVRLNFAGLDSDTRYSWQMFAIDGATSNFMAGADNQELTVVSSGEVIPGARQFSIDLTLPLYGARMVRLIPQ